MPEGVPKADPIHSGGPRVDHLWPADRCTPPVVRLTPRPPMCRLPGVQPPAARPPVAACPPALPAPARRRLPSRQPSDRIRQAKRAAVMRLCIEVAQSLPGAHTHAVISPSWNAHFAECKVPAIGQVRIMDPTWGQASFADRPAGGAVCASEHPRFPPRFPRDCSTPAAPFSLLFAAICSVLLRWQFAVFSGIRVGDRIACGGRSAWCTSPPSLGPPSHCAYRLRPLRQCCAARPEVGCRRRSCVRGPQNPCRLLSNHNNSLALLFALLSQFFMKPGAMLERTMSAQEPFCACVSMLKRWPLAGAEWS